MTIENRNLATGIRLVANYKQQRYVCTVEAAEEGGGVVFTLEDGKTYKSPSAAGSAVMGGSACNGWRFWSVEGGQEPAAQAGDAPAAKAATARKPKAFRLISRIPNQKGVAEGQVRFWCAACMKGFVVDAGETPQVCPEGHLANDPELTAPVMAGAGS